MRMKRRPPAQIPNARLLVESVWKRTSVLQDQGERRGSRLPTYVWEGGMPPSTLLLSACFFSFSPIFIFSFPSLFLSLVHRVIFSVSCLQAACAVCIRVGSFHDPPEVPGLAHLLEHSELNCVCVRVSCGDCVAPTCTCSC